MVFRTMWRSSFPFVEHLEKLCFNIFLHMTSSNSPCFSYFTVQVIFLDTTFDLSESILGMNYEVLVPALNKHRSFSQLIAGWWFATFVIFSIYWECPHPN
jgi:hypothetical protein